MQINRLILFLLFVLLPSISFSESLGEVKTIDNDAHLILDGMHQPKQIIKVKIYNTKYENDEYYAFLETDEAGKYELRKSDIDISRLRDGNIVFEVSTNEEEKSIDIANFTKILDKGLLLKLSAKAAGEFISDGYVNSYEASTYILEGETESNIKELYITISDEKNSTKISYTLSDINLDENATFKIEDVNLSKLEDGKIKIEASGVDIAGNSSQTSFELIKDTVVEKPILLKKIKNNNLSNVLNKKILVASGTSEPEAVIYFEFSQDEVIVNESVTANEKGEWELLGADLDISVFKNNPVNVSIYQIDIAYNKSESYEYINDKYKRPIFPLVPIEIDP